MIGKFKTSFHTVVLTLSDSELTGQREWHPSSIIASPPLKKKKNGIFLCWLALHLLFQQWDITSLQFIGKVLNINMLWFFPLYYTLLFPFHMTKYGLESMLNKFKVVFVTSNQKWNTKREFSTLVKHQKSQVLQTTWH